MFNIYLAIYIIAAIAIGAGGSYKIFGMGQSKAAFLFFIGAVTLFIIFGLKWFSGQAGMFSETPVSWPPTINTCPDYLVYYGRKMPDGTTQDSCIDLIGISKNGGLKVFPKDATPPTSDDYYFSLVVNTTNSSSKNQMLCQRAISAGLTWEGVTNGESCITPSGPVAPGGGGGNGGNCPQN